MHTFHGRNSTSINLSWKKNPVGRAPGNIYKHPHRGIITAKSWKPVRPIGNWSDKLGFKHCSI